MENVLRFAIGFERKGRIKRKKRQKQKSDKKEEDKERTEIDEYANKSLE